MHSSITSALATIALSVSSLVCAEERPDSLSVHLNDASFASRFDAMFGKKGPPNWLSRATESEPASVTMDAKSYTVLLACKKHDCANHQLVIMFDKEAMYGLRFETEDRIIVGKNNSHG